MSFDPQERFFSTKPVRVIDNAEFKCLKFGLYHKDSAKTPSHQVESLLIMTYAQANSAALKDRDPRTL